MADATQDVVHDRAQSTASDTESDTESDTVAATPGETAAAKRDGKKPIGAKDLGIDPAAGDEELFRWLVACLLFGARIRQEVAADAFRALSADGDLTPERLAGADRQHLVEVLGGAGYRRYDETKAGELIRLGQDVVDRYGGRLSALPEGAETPKERRARLQQFSGIGPTASDIFLRDVDWG